MAKLSLADLTATPVTCSPPVSVDGSRTRRRVYNITSDPDMSVVWSQSFRAFAEEQPLSVLPPAELCRWLSPQQFPFCRSYRLEEIDRQRQWRSAIVHPSDTASAAAVEAAESRASRGRLSAGPRNTLMLVSMPCAYVDGGANYAGALYDATRILNAQHRGATPRYARGPVRRYEIAAVGLTPYGHLPDAHFYASTAPWVLQLVHLLPPAVPILVALSSRLRELYAHLGVDAERLHELPPNGAAYADRLLSLVTTPFGALEPLGAAALRRVRTRFVPVPAPPEQRTRLIYLSRRSLSPRRNLRNEIELLAALRHTLQLQPAPAVHTLEVFDGASGQRLVDIARRFSQAALLTGTHGGAFLNVIYCSPGTPIVEIGYKSTSPMAYPSYYHTMARRLGLAFWVVLGEGAYDRPITAPVSEVAALVGALLARRRSPAGSDHKAVYAPLEKTTVGIDEDNFAP